MSSARRELEAALAAGLERDTLAIYADLLLAEGDPRGELIALDLQIEAHGTTTELVARRASLLAALLGHLRPLESPHLPWVGDAVARGFVDELVIDAEDANACERLPAILGSALGPYLRGITIRGDGGFLERALGLVARGEHAWLEQLALVKRAGGDSPVVGDATVARAVGAMPRLRRLAAQGPRVLEEFLHPGLRELLVTGRTALGSLATPGAPYAGVEALDLAFAEPGASGEGAEPPRYEDERFDEDGEVWGEDGEDGERRGRPAAERFELCAERLPALRRLDLSRNEPAGPRAASLRVPGGGTVFDFVGRMPMRARLTHLRLPSLRGAGDAEVLQRALFEMPALVEVELARAFGAPEPALGHPTARFVIGAERWPWPSRERLRPGEVLRVAIPGARAPDVVELDAAVAVMEWRWSALPGDARAAWAALWDFVGGLEGDRAAPFPMDMLLHAIEACGAALDGGGWRELREDMRDHRTSSGALVSIRRGVAA